MHHSVNTKKESDVYVMDSLGGVCPMSHSLQQQIAQVYGGRSRRSQLIDHSRSVQQQVGVKDCGLFAGPLLLRCARRMISPECPTTKVRCAHTLHLAFKRATWTLSLRTKVPENIPRPKGQSVSIPVLAKLAYRSRSSSKR